MSQKPKQSGADFRKRHKEKEKKKEKLITTVPKITSFFMRADEIVHRHRF